MTEENFADAFNAMNAPFAKTLGVRMMLATKERIEAELDVTAEKCTMPPTLHGGAIMAFADNLGGVGAFLNMPEGATTSTVESKTNFLRPAPLGQTVYGVATPIKIGKTLQVWETRITREDGKLVAIVTQTQIILKTD
ncbi:MAG: PaaI family thioesterase [Pseudomonadota bacterium]